MPFASQAPRPYNRSPSTRLGKKGGTQSKCVEKTTDGVRRTGRGNHVEPARVDRLFGHGVAGVAQVVRQPPPGFSLASRRRIDVDERPGECHQIDST